MPQKVTDVLDDAIVPQNNASVQVPNQCNNAQPICPKIGQDCTGTMASGFFTTIPPISSRNFYNSVESALRAELLQYASVTFLFQEEQCNTQEWLLLFCWQGLLLAESLVQEISLGPPLCVSNSQHRT